jgi:hypothetical protein
MIMLWINHPTTPRCAQETARARKVVEARKEKRLTSDSSRHAIINGGGEPV